MQILSRLSTKYISDINQFRSFSSILKLSSSPKSNPTFLRCPLSASSLCLAKNGISTFKTTPFATPKSIDTLHRTDGLNPKKFKLIYKSNFQWFIVPAQVVVVLAFGATIVTSIVALLQSSTSPEEQAESSEAKQNINSIRRKEKESRDSFKRMVGFLDSDSSDPNAIDNIPSPSDILVEDAKVMAVLAFLLVTLAATMFKLMRMLPLRIYVGKKDHCVAVFYGSPIPGRLTRQEFVAGTMKMQKSSFGMEDMMYKDGSGHVYVLMEDCFRRPSDFNYLTGVTKTFDFDEDSSELDQMKQSGLYATQKNENKK